MSEWKWDGEKNDWVEKPFLTDGKFPDLLDVLWLRAEAAVYSNKDQKQASYALFEDWMRNFDKEALKTEAPVELQKDWYMVVTFIVTMYSGAGNEYQNLPAVFGMNFELSSRVPETAPSASEIPQAPDSPTEKPAAPTEKPTAPTRKPKPPANTPGSAAPPEITHTGSPTPVFTPILTPAPEPSNGVEPSAAPPRADRPDDTAAPNWAPVITPGDDSAWLGDGLNPGGNTNPPGLNKDEMPKTGELPLAVNAVPGLMAAAYGLRLMRRFKR
jgi:hypothetical protein